MIEDWIRRGPLPLILGPEASGIRKCVKMHAIMRLSIPITPFYSDLKRFHDSVRLQVSDLSGIGDRRPNLLMTVGIDLTMTEPQKREAISQLFSPLAPRKNLILEINS